MSDRRSFFKKLIGATLAPFLPIPKSESITIPIKGIPVYAGTRKLEAPWSVQIEQDLMVLHGIDLQTEIANTFAKEMQREIDEHVVGELV